MFVGVETLHAGDVVGREREVPEDHDDASGSPSSVGRRTSQVKNPAPCCLFEQTKFEFPPIQPFRPNQTSIRPIFPTL